MESTHIGLWHHQPDILSFCFLGFFTYVEEVLRDIVFVRTFKCM